VANLVRTKWGEGLLAATDRQSSRVDLVSIVNNTEIWECIHDERSALATTWEGLGPADWSTTSWCGEWSVKVVAGHVLAAAEQTIPNFFKEFVLAGFRFDVFADRAAHRLAKEQPEELIRRLRARTATTNRPPAPVVVMLGEVIVHGEDIRRPLGIAHQVARSSLMAVADNYVKTNVLLGAKRRIAGLRLQATDVDWAHGSGPQVTGPLLSLIQAMSGRSWALTDLEGPGAAVMTSRG